jgi:hypothetical protein
LLAKVRAKFPHSDLGISSVLRWETVAGRFMSAHKTSYRVRKVIEGMPSGEVFTSAGLADRLGTYSANLRYHLIAAKREGMIVVAKTQIQAAHKRAARTYKIVAWRKV